MQARHGLLADVAALEVDRAIDDRGLGRHVLSAHVGAEPRPAGLDPNDLGSLVADSHGASRVERGAECLRVAGLDDQVDAEVSGDAEHVRAVPLAKALGMLGAEAIEPGELGSARADQ